MSHDYLASLVGRSFDLVPVIQPRLPGRFEPPGPIDVGADGAGVDPISNEPDHETEIDAPQTGGDRPSILAPRARVERRDGSVASEPRAPDIVQPEPPDGERPRATTAADHAAPRRSREYAAEGGAAAPPAPLALDDMVAVRQAPPFQPTLDLDQPAIATPAIATPESTGAKAASARRRTDVTTAASRRTAGTAREEVKQSETVQTAKPSLSVEATAVPVASHAPVDGEPWLDPHLRPVTPIDADTGVSIARPSRHSARQIPGEIGRDAGQSSANARPTPHDAIDIAPTLDGRPLAFQTGRSTADAPAQDRAVAAPPAQIVIRPGVRVHEAAHQDHAEDTPREPIVHVTIGRVELRTAAAVSTPAARRQGPRVMNLDDYLKQRRGGAA